MNEVLGSVVEHAGDFSHPLMEHRGGDRRALVVVSTDKGLCGSLNSNLLREVARFDAAATVFIAAGRKASQFMARTRRKLVADFTYRDTPLFREARAISRFAQEMYLNDEVDHVDVLYTNFINVMSQRPEVRPFLPMGDVTALDADFTGEGGAVELKGASFEYLFEPKAAEVLSALLPHYLNYQMFQYLLEARASEHSARMVAMKSATDNANQLIKDLTLEYNKVRQAAITKELLEIASAAMALG
jgi:F-type H+-transporting ATPase subunit gamma